MLPQISWYIFWPIFEYCWIISGISLKHHFWKKNEYFWEIDNIPGIFFFLEKKIILVYFQLLKNIHFGQKLHFSEIPGIFQQYSKMVQKIYQLICGIIPEIFHDYLVFFDKYLVFFFNIPRLFYFFYTYTLLCQDTWNNVKIFQVF